MTAEPIRPAILALLAVRPRDATICPSEVARAVSSVGLKAGSWRDAMSSVHAMVDLMAAEGQVRLSWKGRALRERAGPYRIGRARTGEPDGRDDPEAGR